MRIRREFRRRREREYLKYRERATETVSVINRFYESVRKRIRDSLSRITKRITDNVRKSTAERAVTARKLKVMGYSAVATDSREVAHTDIVMNTRYSGIMDTLMKNVTTLSMSGLFNIPENFENFDETKAFCEHYFTPYIATKDHFTMYAIKLTPLTVEKLKGENADFYVSYELEMEKHVSPHKRVAHYLTQILEYLLNLLRRKPKRERIRKKHKGHYGKIDYNEPIHDILDCKFDGISTTKLLYCLLNSYWLKRWKALSLGYPELANHITNVSVLVLFRRKGKYTKLYPDIHKKAEVEDKLRKHAYYKVKS